ncbi:alpha/beta hydrolase [Kitasatospora acidiphila]|uniref:prolyl aminopeptidase n=1 Tax=Kitasatospora acidiphila TaxID=2567942 RepID=A0A540VWR4_9ACTN|nr:alpha/beta fold hydrolase [Kitasatospora acidiphila]TQF01201.1 alpha/beta hydrolase [Kitasatospora acidiphila]
MPNLRTRTRARIGALLGAAALWAGTALAAAPPGQAAEPGLTDAAPCPGAAAFSCATLTVPLDHGGRTPGSLNLRVAVGANTRAPKGDLIFLTGGPGQPGVPFASHLGTDLAPLFTQYRLVMIDQRGTGGGALQCPELQQQMGSSDLAVPTKDAVTDCAAVIGPNRRFFSTADTVADLDQLRRALGDRQFTLDGVSYGSFVAERYALAHPNRVSRMVLDSVVPQQGWDALDLAALPASARVLTAACAATNCGTDPATDLATVVRRYRNGPAVLNMLTMWEFIDPNFAGIPQDLHQAAAGNPAPLRHDLDVARQIDVAAPDELSQGLHASTLCSDGHYPWGTSDTPVAGRAAALERTRDRLTPAQTWPYDAATATGTGSLLTCLNWPREPVPSPPSPDRPLPRVPVLLLGGDRDLSTPLAELYKEAAMAPFGKVVVVPGAAHSVQVRATDNAGRQAVYDFLLH